MSRVWLGVFPHANKRIWNIVRHHSWLPPSGYDTGIKVYNCVARSNVPVVLRNKRLATWYTCGPTVYAPSHLGHASCYVKVDILQRILREYFNINIVTAMNVTDIDDKIIKQTSEDVSWEDVARTNEIAFWEDLKELNVSEPDIKLRVSDHIPHIIRYIAKLVDENIAYVGKDQSVYFKVDQCSTYGKLQNVNLEKGVGTDVKESVVDFALWKSAKSGEPYWDSPWGRGRPGWHIECSAMASRVFGDCVDFHAGGLDLRFPHHENEEAQSCMYHNKQQWVNYWLHAGQLFVKGDSEKMSKSLQNTVSIKQFLERHSSDDFRMACVLSNYGNSMVYSDEVMTTARKTLERLTAFISDCQAYIDGKIPQSEFSTSQHLELLSKTQESIDMALKSDFDTAKATSHLIHLASSIGKAIHSKDSQTEMNCSSNIDSVIAARNFCTKILSMFGFESHLCNRKSELMTDTKDLDVILENIVMFRKNIRDRAKSTKNNVLFKVADDLRLTLEASGIEVKDHEKGSSWRLLRK